MGGFDVVSSLSWTVEEVLGCTDPAAVNYNPLATLNDGSWDGYAGGDAAGLAFETLDWIFEKKIAGYASDTWGNEVRPCETDENINQPWHWIAIPIMGLTMGEIWYLKDLAEDCESDKVYEFMFVGPALPITGAVGSPVNPLAIK